jgi:hypothetical protein
MDLIFGTGSRTKTKIPFSQEFNPESDKERGGLLQGNMLNTP